MHAKKVFVGLLFGIKFSKAIMKLNFLVLIELFSKLQNGGLNGDGAINHCFFLLVLTQPFLNRIQHINAFWTCCIKHFSTSLGPKK
jgi:hypothetical protein